MSAAVTRRLTSSDSRSARVAKIVLMWRSTARFVTTSDAAMAVLLRPSAIKLRISTWRAVSLASFGRSL
jgi:hypothetical protein